MIQNGLPNHDGSASNQSIVGHRARRCARPSACITRNCVSKFASRNTGVRLRRDARDEVVDASAPPSSSHVASKRMVSFENPVAAGDLEVASTRTSSSPATSLSQRCSWPSGLVRVARHGPHGAGTLRPERPVSGRPPSAEIARGPRTGQDGWLAARPPNRRGRHGDRADRRPGVLPRHHAEVPRERVPDPEGARAARRTTTGFEPRLLAPGRRAGLDVAARARGARGRQRQRERARPTSPSWPTRSARTSRPARCSRATSSPPRWPARAATSSRARSSPPWSPASRSPPGPSPSCRPHDRLGDVALRAEADGDDYVLTGVKSPVEAGAAGRPAPRHRAHRRRRSPSSSCPPTRRGVTVTPLRSVDLVRRYAPHPVRRCARRRPSALVGEPGAAAADVERQLQLAGVVQSRRDGRCRRGRVRPHPRLGVQPLLLRSSAGVVPGDQAPLRRHEDVARGQSRARRRRGRGTSRRDDRRRGRAR